MFRLFLLLISLYAFSSGFAQTSFEQKISEIGCNEIITDWSDSMEVRIPRPKIAYVNVIGISTIPKKGYPLKAWLEMYDGNGNYFKKRIMLDGQGRTSTGAPKKNFETDFCDDLWQDENTPSIIIGDWVDQDSYHFKAFYSNYVKGMPIIGYQVYDEITNDRGEYGRMWERAAENIKNPDPRARCFPDAFPCVVYFNGDFQGLYCWQLKKHRKNMNLKKNNSEHVHLHGFMTNAFFKGSIDWSQLEVKNPKSLYDMNGNPYEDYAEPIDETSPYFDLETDDDDTKKIKKNTAKVKSYIKNLCGYWQYLSDLEKGGASRSEIRAAIEERFDVPGMCDYMIHNLLTNNWDGMSHNFQLFTYDGNKWFISPYDLDMTFGYFSRGISSPSYYYYYPLTLHNFKNYALFSWFVKYFLDDIRDRYAQIRNSGALTAENICSLFDTWYYAFGEENNRMEIEKWPMSPSLQDDIPGEGWEFYEPYSYNTYINLPPYSETTEYHEGDMCRAQNQYRICRATKTVKGVRPWVQLGSRDSLNRIQGWMREHLVALDSYMNYSFDSSLQSYALEVSNVGWSTLCLPFQFSVPEGMQLFSVIGRDDHGKLLTEVVETPEANKPYLVKAPPGLYSLVGYTEEADETAEGYLRNGLLQGCYAKKYVPKGNYVLQNHNGATGFFKVADNGTMAIAPNRAYMIVDNDEGNAAEFVFVPDNADDVSHTTVSNNGIVGIYDLSGGRQPRLQKGLNIVRYSNGSTLKITVR